MMEKKKKNIESNSKEEHVIFIDRLVDDHIQKDMKEKAKEKEKHKIPFLNKK